MGEIPFINEQIYGVIVTNKYNKNMHIHRSNNVKDYYSMSLKKDPKKESAKYPSFMLNRKSKVV